MSPIALIVCWIVGGIFLLTSLWFCILNASVFWRLYVRKVEAPSWIPLVGGVLGVFGLLIVPVDLAHKWCWLPLVLDMGTLPGLFYTIVFHVVRLIRGK
jgi:hypothetical protein